MNKERGQAILGFALIVVFAFVVVIYFANSKQNFELAHTVGSNLANSFEASSAASLVSIDVYTTVTEMTVQHAAEKHGDVVYDVLSFCQPGNIQAQMTNPLNNRKAAACFYEDHWWLVIKGALFGDDDIVTIFPRNQARSLEDVMRYLLNAGYR